MDKQVESLPTAVVKKMLEKDYFSKWLGLKLISISQGECTIQFRVKKEMLNGFHSIHGGILFSVADSAFAFACNSRGKINVALECNISYARPAFEGEILTIHAKEIQQGKTTGIYQVEIINETKKMVALFKGTSFNTKKNHFES